MLCLIMWLPLNYIPNYIKRRTNQNVLIIATMEIILSGVSICFQCFKYIYEVNKHEGQDAMGVYQESKFWHDDIE